MRHSVFGRKLSRTKNERRRLFAGLTRDLLVRDRIVTTLAKAKAVQPLVEKLVTLAREGSETSRRRAIAVLTDRPLTDTLFAQAKSRFVSRTSGFTRIIKSAVRRGDATQTAILSFVDERIETPVEKPKKGETKKVKTPPVALPKKPKARKRTK